MLTEKLNDPAEVVRKLHEMGGRIGFERIRVDRSQIGGQPHKPAAWYEVGYGSKEITIRTSTGVRYRATWNRVDFKMVGDLLQDLRVAAGLDRINSPEVPE